MEKIRIKAYGKLNLGLDVLGRRENGYHDVNMVMQTVGIYDTVDLMLTDRDEISLTSTEDDLPCDENNIVYKAIMLIKNRFGIKKGVTAHITKVIPMAAGMGGGSADAAATLIGLNTLFELQLSDEKLRELGLLLGADVPFLIMNGTVLAGGIGEDLRRLPSPPPCTLVLAKPKCGVSTKEVYEAFDELKDPFHPKIAVLIEALEEGSLLKLCENFGNALEEVTIGRHPVIRELKEICVKEGALAALMTGSGPTVFGIFDDETKARAAKEKLLCHDEVERVFVTEWFYGK